ncbi:ATP-binding protein [Candidatus Spongiihabitans sp.]|uniref:ATP-binding protein n=1 Tax=Candidatus Spongiihabitans sp. TaxID=3101308 RepID=UPI003C7C08FB
MLTSHDMLDKINAGESSGVEFKEVVISGGKIKTTHRDHLSDEFAAFANQSGGVVIFGIVDGTHQIKGIDAVDIPALITHISEICHDSIEPPIVNFYVDSIQIPEPNDENAERHLVYVEIERSLWLHNSKNGYFYRHGNSKRKMSTAHVLRVGQSRSQVRVINFDEQSVPNTNQDTLQKELYMRFISDDDTQLLCKRRLLVSNNDTLNATVSGILMCNPTPDGHIYNSYIQAVFYRGKTKDANYQNDAKDYHGPLDKQIIGAYNFVNQYNHISAKKEVGREEKPQYSMRAVFEALVNAVVHRDYAKHGSKIRLFMFSDRLEIYSPGALANTLTVENMIDNQFTRNELLSRLLSELKIDDGMNDSVNRKYFLERRGEGVGIIFNDTEQLSGKRPVYELIGEELKLTIYAAKSLQQ